MRGCEAALWAKRFNFRRKDNYGKKFFFLLRTFQAEVEYIAFFSHVAGSAQESLFVSCKAKTASWVTE